MLNNQLDFTVCSTDPEHYNRINCNLTAPTTRYATLTITCLTANADIIVLNEDDYIEINDKKLCLKTNYSNLNPETLATLLNYLFKENNLLINISLDYTRRFIFTSDEHFTIRSMTYNYKLLLGFFNYKFPYYADFDNEHCFIKVNSTGFYLSTPVLYLLSNIGTLSYRNISDSELSGSKIVMRINNSFSANYPIIVNNAEFETLICSNDLSCLELTLVDAYLKEIKLLTPMYLSIHVKSIPDEKITSIIEELQQNKTQK